MSTIVSRAEKTEASKAATVTAIVAIMAGAVFLSAAVLGVLALASLGLGVILMLVTGGAFEPSFIQSFSVLSLFLAGAWIIRVIVK